VFRDTCTFSSNEGYELQGPNRGTCLADQSLNRGLPSCVPKNCPDRILLLNNLVVSPIFPSCNLMYQSRCVLTCTRGFTGDSVTYLCNVTSNRTMVDWVSIGGVGVMCERGWSEHTATQQFKYNHQKTCTIHMRTLKPYVQLQ